MKNIERAEVMASLLLELLDSDETDDGRYTTEMCDMLETLASGPANTEQARLGEAIRSLYKAEMLAEGQRIIDKY